MSQDESTLGSAPAASAAARSIAALAERVRSIPGELAAYLRSDPARRDRAVACSPSPSRWFATGIGCSEAPARLFVGQLAAGGVAASYVPLSAFLDGNPVPAGARLVVFSQGLSPNARLAFADPRQARRSLLVTSLQPDGAGEAERFLAALVAEGLQVLTVPPATEQGSLVRVVGPAVAMLAAVDLAARIIGDAQTVKQLDQVPQAVAAAFAAAQQRLAALPLAQLGRSPLALVSVGSSSDRTHGLRWKLLEGLGHMDPPVWDLLQVSHGPLQHFYERQLALLVLASEAHPLVERLAQLCRPERHLLVPLPASLPPPLDLFEHDAALNALLLGVLAVSPRDLSAWPAQGLDGPLYELGR